MSVAPLLDTNFLKKYRRGTKFFRNTSQKLNRNTLNQINFDKKNMYCYCGVPPRGVGLYVGSLRSVLRTSPSGCHYYPSRRATASHKRFCSSFIKKANSLTSFGCVSTHSSSPKTIE
jgi:hypothetical protein